MRPTPQRDDQEKAGGGPVRLVRTDPAARVRAPVPASPDPDRAVAPERVVISAAACRVQAARLRSKAPRDYARDWCSESKSRSGQSICKRAIAHQVSAE